jgi:hypothetical protein
MFAIWANEPDFFGLDLMVDAVLGLLDRDSSPSSSNSDYLQYSS